MTITGAARLAGVIGWPVAHSLSPVLHGYWLSEYQIDGAYVPLAVRREDFAMVLRGLRHAGFRGVNVTVPHKEAAFALAHRCDDAAKSAAAANLLIFDEKGGIEARNTDSAGLAASLAEEIGAGAIQGKPVVLIGAGGAARAAILALAGFGPREIRIVNRTRPRADSLADSLRAKVSAKLVAADFGSWSTAAADAALLVNASSAGMKGAEPLALPLDVLPQAAAVCDIVYNPLETDLLARARAAGHRTIDGLGMLLHQAVPAFEAFFGVAPKVTPALRRVLEQALHG